MSEPSLGPSPTQRFADALARRLTAAPMSQQQLAGKLEVTASTVSRWLAGNIEPSPEHVLATETAVEVTAGELSRFFRYLNVSELDRLLPERRDLLGAIDASGDLDAFGRDMARLVITNQIARHNGQAVSFADALANQLHRARRQQDWLAETIGVSGSTVSRWVRGYPPDPRQVFAAETALTLTPGMLSWRLGYVPDTLIDTALAQRPRLVSAVELSGQINDFGREIILVILDDVLDRRDTNTD